MKLKCVVVGDSVVRKSQLLISYTANKFPSENPSAVFINRGMTVKVGEELYTLELFDTSGGEYYDSLRTAFYFQTDIFMVCFSVISPSSFENVQKLWVPEITSHCPGTPFILVGLQIELRNVHSPFWKEDYAQELSKCSSPISFETGNQLAKKLNAVCYMECSARTQQGLKSVFNEVILSALESQTNNGDVCDTTSGKDEEDQATDNFIATINEAQEKQQLSIVEQAIQRKGTLDHNLIHAVFIGPAHSGKSSLMTRLVGEMVTSSSPSTGVAEKAIRVEIRKSQHIAASIMGSLWVRLNDDSEAVQLMEFAARNYDANMKFNQEVLPPSTAENLPLPEGYQNPIEIFRKAIHKQGIVTFHPKQLENVWTLYLTDTGGQMEFQDLLPLLVSGPSIFFLVFRLDQNIHQRFTIEYELPNGNKSHPYQSSMTVMEALLQSLASIAAMGTFTYKHLQKLVTPLRPKVFIVGTHKDQLDQATALDKIREIDQNLQEVIKSTSHYHEDLVQFASETQLIYTVNNLAEDDSDFQLIRSGVNRVGQHGDFKITTPTHWLIFSFVIRQLKSRTITYEECRETARRCGIDDEAELKEMLMFLHTKMGLIRYFPTEGLDNIVIKDPQLLFDKVTELIVETFTFEKAGKLLCDKFKSKGIFTIRDFERICHNSDLFTPLQLVKLLEHLRIVAPFETDAQNTSYFIPCVLAHGEKPNSELSQTQSSIPSLLFAFACGYCPKGLSAALIKYLLTNEMKSHLGWQLLSGEIFRDQVSFLVGPFCDMFTLKIFPTHLEVMCFPQSQRSESSMNEICVEVSHSIEKGITEITRDINYIDAKHSLAFHCQVAECSHVDQHPADMKWYKQQPCSLWCQKSHKSFSLPPGHKIWIQQTEHDINLVTAALQPTISGESKQAVHDNAKEGPNARVAFELLFPGLASQWENIGMLLELPEGKLETIRVDENNQSANCLREMLKMWTKQLDPLPTWQALVDAVKPFHPSKAKEIEEHYL